MAFQVGDRVQMSELDPPVDRHGVRYLFGVVDDIYDERLGDGTTVSRYRVKFDYETRVGGFYEAELVLADLPTDRAPLTVERWLADA